MAGIVNTETFFSGDSSVASRLYEQIYGVGENSLENINGQLTSANVAENPDITYMHVQKNSFTGSGSAAGTASIDFFAGGSAVPVGSGWYRNITHLGTSKGRYLAIPGGCTRFYLPYEARVLCLWSVTWSNDSNNADKTSNIAFFIDDDLTAPDQTTLTNAQTRRVRQTRIIGSSNGFGNRTYYATETQAVMFDRYKQRSWSGHYLTPRLAPGYHTIGLRVAAHSSVKQTRVKARSMKYIYFRI